MKLCEIVREVGGSAVADKLLRKANVVSYNNHPPQAEELEKLRKKLEKSKEQETILINEIMELKANLAKYSQETVQKQGTPSL